jgi:hypothetical protein
MTSVKVAVRSTIDFLPDTGEFDAVVALRGDDEKWYGCREQRFADLQEALHWVGQIYPAMVTLWQADQKTVSEKEAPSGKDQPGRTVVFVPPWLDEQGRRDELKEELRARQRQQRAGHDEP